MQSLVDGMEGLSDSDWMVEVYLLYLQVRHRTVRHTSSRLPIPKGDTREARRILDPLVPFESRKRRHEMFNDTVSGRPVRSSFEVIHCGYLN
jgi:hypothetical protein